MLKKTREVEALLPSLARTDRPVEEIVWLAVTRHSTGDTPQRLKCEEMHATPEEHEADFAAGNYSCYVSNEDAELAIRLSESMVPVLQWAVEKGWGWRREGGGRVRRKYVRKAGVTG